MSEEALLGWHTFWVAVELLAAVVTVVVLVFVRAPYGRHDRPGWGPTLPARIGWIVMESPAVLLFAAFYLSGPHAFDQTPLTLLGLWMLHYVHRTFVFPFRIRSEGRRMPMLVAAIAFAFNTLNAWNNATWLSTLGDYPASWLVDPRLALGSSLFFLGLWINVWADTKLIALRRDGSTKYKIPRGGLYEWITCPNYFGEILEWIGWAIATWSFAGLAFAIYVMANLIPRALANHAWYRETFADYPTDRRALLPFLV